MSGSAKRVLLRCVAAGASCLVLAAAIWQYTHYRARVLVTEHMEQVRERVPGPERLCDTVNTLSRLGPAGIEALARELRSDEKQHRSEARFLLFLLDFMYPARADLGTYARLVADQRIDLHVRLTLARTILSRAPCRPDRSIRRHMEVALGDPVPAVRGVAAAVLWRMGGRGEEFIKPLARALELLPREEDVERIVITLDRPDEPTPEARETAPEKPVFAGNVAAEALRGFGERAVPALAAAVAEGDGSTRAAELLAELGPKAAPAAPALVERLIKGWPWSFEDWDPELLQPEDDPAERALEAIGPGAADAVVAELRQLPEGEGQRVPRLRLLLLLDRMGCVTLDVALLHLYGKNERRSRWGAWHVTKFLLEAAPTELSSHSALRPGEGGSPPECVEKLLERRWMVVDLLEKDYEQLPSKYPGIPYMWGGGPKEPWWETTRYHTWVKALGYKRASARRLATWLIGAQAKDDPKVRGCGDVPPVLLKCAKDPDEGVRSAARWAIGILKAETAPRP